MGVYQALVSNVTLVVLSHEPTTAGETISFANPPEWIRNQIQEGNRYTISLGFTEFK